MDTLLRRPSGLLLFRRVSREAGRWRHDSTYKLLIAAEGDLRFRTRKQHVTLTPGQFAILNPQEPHQQLGFDGQKLLIELELAFLREVAHSVCGRQGDDVQFALQQQKHPQLTQWARFTLEMLRMADGEEEGFFLDHALAQLALLLLKVGTGSHSADLPVTHLHRSDFGRVMEAMKQDYAHAWTLAEMAEVAGMNRYLFAHRFKEMVGISPYAWLQLYRLVRSQELLKRTDRTVLEIALSCGFSSLSVYHQLFQRMYGCSPGAFRKRYSE